MKKIFTSFLAVACGLTLATSCIEEFEPQSNYASADQAGSAPNSYQNFVDGITSNLAHQFTMQGSEYIPYDYGYPSFFLMRDVMGQDIALDDAGNWYNAWYTCSVGLGPIYLLAQYPWTYYYGWIKNCNTVISLAGSEPSEEHITGAGIAYAMRAMFYMDLARMFANTTYGLNKESETVPIVTESTSLNDLTNNPRATNEKMYEFIISDLDKAEQYLADYQRTDKYTPDLSVVYGLKARAYLIMENWPEAERYAKLAQQGYSLMDETTYTSRETGFNTPNSAWMFAIQTKASDPCMTANDADSSWGSIMCLETNGSGCGYASSYGYQLMIDRHLYETIPATDFRKKCFVDFAIDELGSREEKIAALEAYSDYPDWVYTSGYEGEGYEGVGGMSLKFRVTGGDEGHNNQYVGWLVSIPLMRVEEMYLIEAEAAGMQEESRGIQLLTTFAKTRDPQYVYGLHNEAYGNSSTSQFQNEVWWQRRVELWGEGFATFDIKRLNKGIIRSYANTNHLASYRWNTTTPPDWMNLCIVQTETNYNLACTNNPAPIAPTEDSEEFVW